MSKPGTHIASTWFALILAFTTFSVVANFQDPLDTPASPGYGIQNSQLTAVATAGSRLVAVGPRGAIIYLDDESKGWIQASVPVSSDLVAVHFPSSEQGWAVGHDGVVLHSDDGGRSWQKQLDGMQAARLMEAYYSHASQADSTEAERALIEAAYVLESGPVYPLLDVWFENEQHGYIVGAFGMAFVTDDGGASWEPWFTRVDNPMGLHLYGVQGGEQGVYVVGEQGLIARLDRESDSFVAVNSPYEGTLFGVVMDDAAVIAYGMRGHVFRSVDQGESWAAVDSHVKSGVVGGDVAADGRIVLVTQGGELLIGRDGGQTLTRYPSQRPMALADTAALLDGRVVVVGESGAAIEPLK